MTTALCVHGVVGCVFCKRQSTHWQGCWRADGHHACAVALLERILASDTWAAECAELGCTDDHNPAGSVTEGATSEPPADPGEAPGPAGVHSSRPLLCENCGKAMAEHDAMALCWPEGVPHA